MRIAILWTRLSGYLNACIRELAARSGVELCVIHQAPGTEAPFDEHQFGWIANRMIWRSQPDVVALQEQLRLFSPEILVIAGWHIPAYRKVAKEYRGKCLRIMSFDRSWEARLKQRIGSWVAPYYVKPIADLAWVPGERQAVLAKKLGFEQRAILRGLYSCDHSAFAAVHAKRLESNRPLPRSFMYAGRFSVEKGLDTLVKAYRIYRETNSEPWPLLCFGAGPLRSLLEGERGVRVEGFVQPQNLPDRFASVGCLILSSKFEPWALVIHEAVSAGLLVLASERAGAAVHLVQPGYNGFIVGSEDPAGLANCMSKITAMSDAQLDTMSRASYSLSLQYSPQHWADTLLDAPSFVVRGVARHRDSAMRHQ